MKPTDRPPATPPGQASSHYRVLARRWRPRQFEDLIGQEAISQALRGAITSGRVAHAYLFAGHRGVGKTSTARILAKALNCTQGPTPSPCDRCDACESIASGDDVDVLEIDGASNRGIDEVRELRQNAHLRPTRSRYKIYIIDEVHMLTREAFNALLKTLEEPPQHVKFIFATTDPQKVPVTILSRCQRFDFRGISSDEIRKQLEKIVAAEGVAVDGDALELLTRRAAGSMRDAQSLLDQLLAFGTDQVSAQGVHRLLGTADEDRVLALVSALLSHDAASALRAVDAAETEGVQLGELADQLIEYFRDLMVLRAAGDGVRLLSVSERQKSQARAHAGRLPLETLLAAADILAELKNRLRNTNYGRVLVDIALVRIAQLEELAPLSELAEQLAALEARLDGNPPLAQAGSAAAPAVSAAPAPVSKKNFIAPAEATAAVTREPTDAGHAHAVPPLDPPEAQPASAANAALTADSATHRLRAIARELNPVLAESIARAQLSVGPAPNMLVLCLDGMYNAPGRVKEIENALQQRIGNEFRIRVELSGKPDPATQPAPARRSSYSERLGEATRDPLVQEAMDLFGARVTRVEES